MLTAADLLQRRFSYPIYVRLGALIHTGFCLLLVAGFTYFVLTHPDPTPSLLVRYVVFLAVLAYPTVRGVLWCRAIGRSLEADPSFGLRMFEWGRVIGELPWERIVSIGAGPGLKSFQISSREGIEFRVDRRLVDPEELRGFLARYGPHAQADRRDGQRMPTC